jgi:hypothetical protein
LLTQTTWGGTGAEVATAVATAADGSAYLVGSTDSFAFDQFGQPATRMFIVKLSNGAVVWQRIWNGPTIVGGDGYVSERSLPTVQFTWPASPQTVAETPCC